MVRKRAKSSSDIGKDDLFPCEVLNCQKRFTRFSSLKAHRLIHTGSRPYECTVDGCSASYTRKQHLVRHTTVSHVKDDGFYRCQAENCIATFDTNESLSQHFRRAHFGSRLNESLKLNCELCNVKFSSISSLQQHMTSLHRYKCRICNRLFSTQLCLKNHESSHETEKSKSVKECTLCDLKFENFNALLQHRKTREHLEKQVIVLTCSECGKTFNNQGNFNYHVQTHSKDREIFRCSFADCDRTYYYWKNLRHHVRVVHEPEHFPRPKCSLCNKDFSAKHRLEKHQKVIHGLGDTDETKSEKSDGDIHPADQIDPNRNKLIQSLSSNQKTCGKYSFNLQRPPGKLLSGKTKTSKNCIPLEV